MTTPEQPKAIEPSVAARLAAYYATVEGQNHVAVLADVLLAIARRKVAAKQAAEAAHKEAGETRIRPTG